MPRSRAHAAGPVCGAYTTHQLRRGGALPAAPPAALGRRLAAWGSALAALALAASPTGAAQAPTPVESSAEPTADRRASPPASASRVFRGRVVEAGTGETLPGANLYAPALGIGVASNIDGDFALDLSGVAADAWPVHVEVSFAGFAPQVWEVHQDSEQDEVVIGLAEGDLGVVSFSVVIDEPDPPPFNWRARLRARFGR